MEPAVIKFLLWCGVGFLAVILIILKDEGILKTPTRKKTEQFPKDGKNIDFIDELRNYMSAIIGNEPSYANPSFIRSLMFYSVRHTDKINGKTIECASIRFRFQLLLFANGSKQILIHSESNFGSPTWTGSKMLYNYDIVYNEFQCSIEDFKQTWGIIVDKFFVVNTTSDEMSDRVKDGSMSYWIEKEYGNLL